MDNFCEKCGCRLGSDGKCPKCDVTSKTSTAKKKAKKIFVVVLVILILYTVALITLGTLVYMDKINIPILNDIFITMGLKEEQSSQTPFLPEEAITETDPEQKNTQDEVIDMVDSYEVPAIDADEYYEKNSTVASKFDASNSQNTLSESAVYELFEQRGFVNVAITTNYDMNGNYSDDKVISAYSSTLHPIYHALYTTPSGNIWSIHCTDGNIMAVPLFYEGDVMVVLSETNTITSYDNVTNKFFVNTPNADVAKIQTVGIIDSQTLDQFTME